jgi:hypothetical protein
VSRRVKIAFGIFLSGIACGITDATAPVSTGGADLLGRRGRGVTLTEDLRVPRELEVGFPLAGGDASNDDRPAIHAVDEIFDAAIRAGASDVHVEPFGEGGRVRERVDGMLRDARAISQRLLPRVLSRIKLLGG